jgi:hypothetical protein
MWRLDSRFLAWQDYHSTRAGPADMNNALTALAVAVLLIVPKYASAASQAQQAPDYCEGFGPPACQRIRAVVEARAHPAYCVPGFGRADNPVKLSDEQLRICYALLEVQSDDTAKTQTAAPDSAHTWCSYYHGRSPSVPTCPVPWTSGPSPKDEPEMYAEEQRTREHDRAVAYVNANPSPDYLRYKADLGPAFHKLWHRAHVWTCHGLSGFPPNTAEDEMALKQRELSIVHLTPIEREVADKYLGAITKAAFERDCSDVAQEHLDELLH